MMMTSMDLMFPMLISSRVTRVNWLRAKAHHCRWAEEIELVNATTSARIAVVENNDDEDGVWMAYLD